MTMTTRPNQIAFAADTLEMAAQVFESFSKQTLDPQTADAVRRMASKCRSHSQGLKVHDCTQFKPQRISVY